MEAEQIKKESFWKQLQKSKWKQILFFVGSMAVLVAIFLPLNAFFRSTREKELLENLGVSTDYDIWFGLDEVNEQGKDFRFSGWMLRKDSKVSRVRLILNAIDGSDAKIYFAENGKRKDAEEYFEADWETGSSGFSVEVPSKEIEADTTYEVQLVLYYDKEIVTEEEVAIEEAYNKINTGWYLYNGELYRYDPVVFVEPEVEDEELKQVVSEGFLCSYDMDTGMYIYFYEDSLYWIVDSNCEYLSEKMHVPYQPRTVHIENLPEHRQKYGYDNLDFLFGEGEIDVEDSRYRIAVKQLPEEYAITYITTGIYDDTTQKWVYRKTFQTILN